MSRICVVGNIASGKSSLSDAISDVFDLPVIHLDELYWRDDWSHASVDEFLLQQAEVLKTDRWVCDGCYMEIGMMQRFQAANMIIFLDIPSRECWWHLITRIGHHKDFPADDSSISFFLFLYFLCRVSLFKVCERPRVLRAIQRSGTPSIRVRKWADERKVFQILRNM